jgi:hypothetical protein
MRVGQALGAQPSIKGNSIQLNLVKRQRPFGHGNGVSRCPLYPLHGLGKQAVLGQGAGTHPVHRQQTSLPLVLKVQALLRAVAQVAFIVGPAARHALAQAQFFQQVLHVWRTVAGHRQVVRAQRARQAAQLARTGVATGLVLQLQQGKVIVPLQAQSPRCRQPRHTTTGNERVNAAGDGGLRRGARLAGQAASGIAQGVATFPVGAQKTAWGSRRFRARAATRHRQRGTGPAEQEVAAWGWHGESVCLSGQCGC